MNRIHTSLIALLLASGFAATVVAAVSPYDIPKVERGSDPASQTIGKKPCGSTWIPYTMRCDLTSSAGVARAQSASSSAPLNSRYDRNGLALQDCEQFPPVMLDVGKMEAKAPSKESMESDQPWIDIAKGEGRKWRCGFGSIDEYLLKDRANDRCAQNDHGACVVSWWNRYDGGGFNNALTRPVAAAIADFVKVQRELKLPEVMIFREEDCSAALSREYLQAFGKDSGGERRMDSPRWVECAMEGRAQSWRGVSQAVEVMDVPCGKEAIYKGLICETYTVLVDGKKKVFRGVRPSFAAARDFSQGGYAMLMQELGNCDSRIANEAAEGNRGGRQKWTRKHLEMLREHCAVAGVAFANPDVTAWAQSVVAKYDRAIAITPSSARIDQR